MGPHVLSHAVRIRHHIPHKSARALTTQRGAVGAGLVGVRANCAWPCVSSPGVRTRASGRATEPLARQMVDVLEHCVAEHQSDPYCDPRSDWSQFVAGEMSGDAECVPSRVAAHGPDEAAVAERALAVSDHVRPIRLPSDDLVHGDINLGNALIDADGNLVGVIDITALGAGSRAIDYAALRHGGADEGDDEGLSCARGWGTRGRVS